MGIDTPDPATFFDHTLRFRVPSESDPNVTYMVELDSYSGNGRCDCPDFTIPRKKGGWSKESILSRMITPQEAFDRGLVTLPKSGRIADCLRCKHIVNGRDELATVTIKTVAHVEKIHAAKAQH